MDHDLERVVVGSEQQAPPEVSFTRRLDPDWHARDAPWSMVVLEQIGRNIEVFIRRTTIRAVP